MRHIFGIFLVALGIAIIVRRRKVIETKGGIVLKLFLLQFRLVPGGSFLPRWWLGILFICFGLSLLLGG